MPIAFHDEEDRGGRDGSITYWEWEESGRVTHFCIYTAQGFEWVIARRPYLQYRPGANNAPVMLEDRPIIDYPWEQGGHPWNVVTVEHEWRVLETHQCEMTWVNGGNVVTPILGYPPLRLRTLDIRILFNAPISIGATSYLANSLNQWLGMMGLVVGVERVPMVETVEAGLTVFHRCVKPIEVEGQQTTTLYQVPEPYWQEQAMALWPIGGQPDTQQIWGSVQRRVARGEDTWQEMAQRIRDSGWTPTAPEDIPDITDELREHWDRQLDTHPSQTDDGIEFGIVKEHYEDAGKPLDEKDDLDELLNRIDDALRGTKETGDDE